MDIRVRQWTKLPFLDSENVLRGLRKVAETVPLHALPTNVTTLRRRDLRKYAEGRQAALFCYAMSRVEGSPVSFAMAESSDYDVVAKYVRGDIAHYVPVQLKELVPDHVNPNASLQAELDKISKYVDSHDLVVAIHLHTRRRITFDNLRFPVGHIGELWLFGATSQNQDHWLLLGDMLKEQKYAFPFRYPEA